MCKGLRPRCKPSPTAEEFLKTSYKTRGQKKRKEELFPDLQKEVEEDKKKQKSAETWTDKTSEAFKEEVVKQALPNLGTQLTKPQRLNFCKKSLRVFAARFWIAGCPPAKVTGFRASVHLSRTQFRRYNRPFHCQPLTDSVWSTTKTQRCAKD